jgi:rare lipoprotein A
MYHLTAAHRTVPFGTYALVTNLDNGQQVRVRINDRGPALASRVLDLSYAAARRLDMVQSGMARVKVEFDGLVP